MSKFTDTVKQDTPRLVVMFRRPAPDQEQFQWGVVGKMPLLTLIGVIGNVQAGLRNADISQPDECEESALVIAWDQSRMSFDYFLHPDIPLDSLSGMLETIKAALVGSQVAQQARNQQVGLLGPDGQPMRRR